MYKMFLVCVIAFFNMIFTVASSAIARLKRCHTPCPSGIFIDRLFKIYFVAKSIIFWEFLENLSWLCGIARWIVRRNGLNFSSSPVNQINLCPSSLYPYLIKCSVASIILHSIWIKYCSVKNVWSLLIPIWASCYVITSFFS